MDKKKIKKSKKNTASPKEILDQAIKGASSTTASQPEIVPKDMATPSKTEGSDMKVEHFEMPEKEVTSAKVGTATSPLETTDASVHKYDEVKFTKSVPALVTSDDRVTRYGTSDYLVPRPHCYEAVTTPALETNGVSAEVNGRMRLSASYEIPIMKSPDGQDRESPLSPAGYMMLHARTPTDTDYSAPEVKKKAGVSKQPVIAAKKVLKSFSSETDILGSRSRNRTSWIMWLAIVSIIVGLISLLFSIIALGLSGANKNSSGDGQESMNLMAKFAQIRAQLEAISRRACSTSVSANCTLKYINNTEEFACETTPTPAHGEKISTYQQSIGCAVDTSLSSTRVQKLSLFSSSLFYDSTGYKCRCYQNYDPQRNSTDYSGVKCK